MQGVFVLIDLTYVFKFAADLVVKADTDFFLLPTTVAYKGGSPAAPFE